MADATGAFPYVQRKNVFNTSFPLSSAEASPPSFSTTPPVPYLVVVVPNHVLPRTYEWNATVERSLGKSGVITIMYIGAAGRKLMREDLYNSPNPNFTQFALLRNGARSGYNTLQAQFRHRLSRGLQTLLSYTWAHSIDNISTDAFCANVPSGASPISNRGSSDYDIRHTFAGAVSCDIPAPGPGIWKSIFGNWSTGSIVYARTAPSVNIVTRQNTFWGLSLSRRECPAP